MKFVHRLVSAISRLRSGAIELVDSRFQRQLAEINRRGTEYHSLSDELIQQRLTSIRQSISSRTSLDDVLIDIFAIVREVASRTTGMRPYNVQILAGLVMHDRKLAEMQTGEGKTLAAVLPASLSAFVGQGVHVLTFNDYLAARDAEWMGPIYRFLGLTVGHVEQGMSAEERRAAYACDVTYVTAKEAGFDFLRDQVCREPHCLVQRGFHFAIVDEADSILIDEARVPLVIAGPTDDNAEQLYDLAEIVRELRPGRDYSTDEGWRNVNFNSAGLDRVQAKLRCGELHRENNVELLTRLNLALHAEVLLRRDIDYLVRDGEIALIDELTGRVAENRRWPYGLQAAIEAKEGVAIRPQGRILNSITLQHFLEQYKSIAGMTGTAQDAAEELNDFYGLKVIVIPPNRPCIRHDHEDRVYATKQAKYGALVAEIRQAFERGRPVLVGTASVAESECLALMLGETGIPCQVLNAKNDLLEAAVILDAGSIGAVTISTNMAGRGTDIRLGGDDERDRDRVVSLGGLLVLGTNRHESRRIDNQLRGRAGRQGDPGESRFHVSLEDDLIHRHGIADMIASPAPRCDAAIADPGVSRKIAHVQRIIEGQSFEIRQTLRKYSICLERQRRRIYARRRATLMNEFSSNVLRANDPPLYEQLVMEFGASVVHEAERLVTLCQIDRCWSDHLAVASEIREGIHLLGMGGGNPFDEFNRQLNLAFRELLRRIDDEILQTLRKVQFTAEGIDREHERLTSPSSTWTYMINDNPMGDIFDRLTRGIKRMLRRS